jgi:predicted alpha/beta-fold hydrolase
MWESLATTRRQDRVLHGAAKALNIVVGLIAFPVWLVGQRLAGALRRFLERIAPDPEPLPVPPAGERSMDALMAELEAMPHGLRHRPLAEPRVGLADISNFVVSQLREGSVLGYAYPAQFRDHVFDGADGERISAAIALHDAPRPGLIVIHGLFTSRRFDYVRRIAVDAYYEWGFNVAAMDLRSFGHTQETTSAPSTSGWKEGEDIIELARYLQGLGATSVGTLGISLGASAVLAASHPEGADQALEGGILAVSPPAEPRVVAERLSRKVPRTHPAYALNYFFHAALRARVRAGGWPEDVNTLSDAIERISAPYYEVSAHEIWNRASAINNIARARVPVLVLHPVDDVIVKVEEAEKLTAAAEGNELVRVWRLPAGRHGILEAIDHEWTFGVYRRFFERWARYAERGEEGPRPAAEAGVEPAAGGVLAADRNA